MGCCRNDSDDKKKGEFCAKLWRYVIFIVAFMSIVLSGVAIASCRFLYVSYDESQAEDLPNGTALEFDMGLWLYDPSEKGCVAIPKAFQEVDYQQTAARLAGAASIILGLIGVVLIWVEFICCRFCGGRFLQVIAFVGASMSQACTFLLFGSDICTRDLSQPYPCRIRPAGYFSICATVAYLACSICICCTRKPEPICVSIKEHEHNDPCCCRSRKHDNNEDEEEGVAMEEQPNAADDDPIEPTPLSPPHEPRVAAAVVVSYEDDPEYLSSRDTSTYGEASLYPPPDGEDGHTAETMSYWPKQKNEEVEESNSAQTLSYWPNAKKEGKKVGTQASLPPYRDVAFIDSEAFFDTDQST